MAAASIPKPGAKLGPCRQSCNHLDCLRSRAVAGKACALCERIIGYDRRYYGVTRDVWPELPIPEGAYRYAHADCLEDWADQRVRV